MPEQEPPERAQHPSAGTPVVLPDPGVRFRVLYVTWRSCSDWQTRGSLLRVAFTQARRRMLGR